mgnify:CR=1 FL=1|tara:strand:+ start:6998 stop:7651 length:654 start_codon:yes stop_codon:yes gene_type:complete
MPTELIYSTTSGDGYVGKSSGTYAGARDATTGSFANSSLVGNSFGIRSSVTSARGGTLYVITRSFFYFNVSSITQAPTSGVLKVRGRTFGNSDVVAVKANHGLTISTADFDAINGWQTGVNNFSNVTIYGNVLTSWDTSGFNSFTLTSDALTDIRSNNTFQVCLLDFPNDLRNIAPTSSSNYSGVWYADYGDTAYWPHLDLTMPDASDNAMFFGANF